jgi:hypothetical protein
MFLMAEVLLVETLLVGVLPLVVLLEKKEKILPELEIPEEEGELPLSGALFVPWYSWHLFSFAGWTGGIGTFAFGPCRCTGLLI